MGRGGDPELYEYHLEQNLLDTGFFYQPRFDGLPTASGIHQHFTHGKQTSTFSTDLTSFTRDYYEVNHTSSIIGGQRIDLSNPEFITFSGSGRADEDDLRHYFVSSEPMDATRSFEVTASIALPNFTEDILTDSGGVLNNPWAFFALGLSDGLNPPWADGAFGREDPRLFQAVDIRVGVSGTFNDPTVHGPFSAHLVYIDGFNNQGQPTANRLNETFSTYNSGSDVTLSGAFADFKEFKLRYTYETDQIEGFLDDLPVGSTTLRRKFDEENGVRVRFGWRINVAPGTALGAAEHPATQFDAQFKDLKIEGMGDDKIEDRRLVTVISGSVGSYFHEKWDMTLTSGVSWVYDTDIYVPTSRRFEGFDYVVSLAGIGDGHRLVELVAYIGANNRKEVALISDEDKRDDRNTYLGGVRHFWDDIDIGKYRIVRDAETDIVNVFIDGSEEPDISVSYFDLPRHDDQHIYYGKVNYGAFQRIFESPTLVGSWISQPQFSGPGDPVIGKRAFNGGALFATVDQLVTARATFELDTDLGEVDLFTFYHAEGYDTAFNTPFTVVSSGIVNFPSPVGSGNVIVSVENGIDEFDDLDISATTIRVDQRRTFTGKIANPFNKKQTESSGWVFLGRYKNPSKVVITADALPGTDEPLLGGLSTQAFVCADAIGVDIGKFGRSTATISVEHVRYQVGQTELTPIPFEPSGLTIIDLSNDQRIDSYGEQTTPALLDGDITSGDVLD